MAASKKLIRSLEEAQELIDGWFNHWGNLLGVLPQWLITLRYVDPKKLDSADSLAETAWPFNYKHANISLNKECVTKHDHSLEELEGSVVHELMHLVLFQLWELSHNQLGGTTKTAFLDAVETAVDLAANMILRQAQDTSECDYPFVVAHADTGEKPEPKTIVCGLKCGFK